MKQGSCSKDGRSRRCAPGAADQEGYVVIKNNELFLIGTHISPLPEASTHINPDPVRTRKLLLHSEEISKLISKVEQRGYTLVPLNFHYKGGRVKCEIGFGQG